MSVEGASGAQGSSSAGGTSSDPMPGVTCAGRNSSALGAGCPSAAFVRSSRLSWSHARSQRAMHRVQQLAAKSERRSRMLSVSADAQRLARSETAIAVSLGQRRSSFHAIELAYESTASLSIESLPEEKIASSSLRLILPIRSSNAVSVPLLRASSRACAILKAAHSSRHLRLAGQGPMRALSFSAQSRMRRIPPTYKTLPVKPICPPPTNALVPPLRSMRKAT